MEEHTKILRFPLQHLLVSRESCKNFHINQFIIQKKHRIQEKKSHSSKGPLELLVPIIPVRIKSNKYFENKLFAGLTEKIGNSKELFGLLGQSKWKVL
jgi:hypothetical protein